MERKEKKEQPLPEYNKEQRRRGVRPMAFIDTAGEAEVELPRRMYSGAEQSFGGSTIRTADNYRHEFESE